MRAISLWQPWATLVALAEKEYETRSWFTDYRGPLAIHAAKRFSVSERELFYRQPFLGAFQSHGLVNSNMLPLGAVICTVELVDCVPTEWARTRIRDKGIAFGNYGGFRWAWKFANITVLDMPVPYRGSQKWFNYDYTRRIVQS